MDFLGEIRKQKGHAPAIIITVANMGLWLALANHPVRNTPQESEVKMATSREDMARRKSNFKYHISNMVKRGVAKERIHEVLISDPNDKGHEAIDSIYREVQREQGKI